MPIRISSPDRNPAPWATQPPASRVPALKAAAKKLLPKHGHQATEDQSKAYWDQLTEISDQNIERQNLALKDSNLPLDELGQRLMELHKVKESAPTIRENLDIKLRDLAFTYRADAEKLMKALVVQIDEAIDALEKPVLQADFWGVYKEDEDSWLRYPLLRLRSITTEKLKFFTEGTRGEIEGICRSVLADAGVIVPKFPVHDNTVY